MCSIKQTTVFFVLTTRYLCKRVDFSVPFLGNKDTPAILCRRISVRYTTVYQSLTRRCSVGSLRATLRILIFQHSCFPFFSSRSWRLKSTPTHHRTLGNKSSTLLSRVSTLFCSLLERSPWSLCKLEFWLLATSIAKGYIKTRGWQLGHAWEWAT